MHGGGRLAGETLVAFHAALALAQALGGDVVVTSCMEILPKQVAWPSSSQRG